ncbi:MAG: DUF4058 family protein [Cyanobacteria bacterium P01_A01_bin.135]
MGVSLTGTRDLYLEQAAFWSSFHSRWIIAMADAIEASLGPGYYVEVEARTYLDEGDGGVLVDTPDAVVTMTSDRAPQKANLPGSVAVQANPQTVTVPLPEEITERYLEIRALETGAVITAIELLSPKSKRSGVGRTAYLKKRQQVLGSLTHLVSLLAIATAGVTPSLRGTLVEYPVTQSPQMRFLVQLLGFALMLLGVYFLGRNIIFTTNASPYFWRGLAADLSVLCLVLGVVWLLIMPIGARHLGWVFIIAGIVFVFGSSRAILNPTSLWQFFVAFAAMSSGYKMLATGRSPF